MTTGSNERPDHQAFLKKLKRLNVFFKDHEKRVYDEYCELDLKLDSLEAFLRNSNRTTSVSTEELALLQVQFSHMLMYHNTLEDRLKLFLNRVEKNPKEVQNLLIASLKMIEWFDSEGNEDAPYAELKKAIEGYLNV